MTHRFMLPCLVVLGILAPEALRAQAYKVELSDKVIRTDDLNMPGNTSVYTILTMLPDLLQRPGTSYISNYDVMIDGMSVPVFGNAALQQLQILDVERIEVSESSMSGYLKKGQAGSINIVLRSGEKNKVWGSAGLEAAYPTDVAPQVLVGYRTDKFQVKGIIMGDYNSSSTPTETDVYNGDSFISSSTKTLDAKGGSQLARAYMTWQPSEKDKFNLNISQSFSREKDINITDHESSTATTDDARSLLVHTYMRYSHSFAKSSLSAEIQYLYNPGNNGKSYPLVQNYNNDYSSNTVAGKVDWTASLLPSASKYSLNLSTGCNLNCSFRVNSIDSEMADFMYSHSHTDPRNNSRFIQPYVSMKTTLGKFRLKFSAEYQSNVYNIIRNEQRYSAPCNDFTGSFIAEWHPDAHKNLRLILDRTLSRPTEDQLFPYLTYSLEYMRYVEGNPDLLTTLSHGISLDYISDYKWGEHSLMFDAKLSYYNVSRIISQAESDGDNPDGGLGLVLKYLTYSNDGTAGILNADFMTLYRYKAFTLSLTGNLYHYDQTLQGIQSRYTYCNVALNTNFNLEDGWLGGLKVTRSSRVTLANGSLGGNTNTTLMLGKRWDHLFVHVFDRVSLQKSSLDVTPGSGEFWTETLYDMVPNLAGIGVRYSF